MLRQAFKGCCLASLPSSDLSVDRSTKRSTCLLASLPLGPLMIYGWLERLIIGPLRAKPGVKDWARLNTVSWTKKSTTWLIGLTKTRLAGSLTGRQKKVQGIYLVDTKALSEGTSVDAAAYDFSDNLRPLTANINVESEPARGLMHLAGSQDNPTYSQLLQQGQRQVLSNDQGQDMISLAAGGLTRQTAPGYGYYKGVSAPADTIRVMAAPSSGSNQIDPASKGFARRYSSNSRVAQRAGVCWL